MYIKCNRNKRPSKGKKKLLLHYLFSSLLHIGLKEAAATDNNNGMNKPAQVIIKCVVVQGQGFGFKAAQIIINQSRSVVAVPGINRDDLKVRNALNWFHKADSFTLTSFINCSCLFDR